MRYRPTSLRALGLLTLAGCGSHAPTWEIEGRLSPVLPIPSDRQFQAGIGKADITPPPGVGLAGNGPEGARGVGYRKRLYARVVVLQDASGERLVLVTADLPHVSALLQREVARRTVVDGIGVDRLVFSATHTHSGPGHFYESKQYNESNSSVPGYDAALVDTIASRIATTISHAVHHLQAARAAWGSTPVWGQTRIRSLPAMLRNEPRPTPRPGAPIGLAPAYALVDPTLTMLRIDLFDSTTGRFKPAGAWSVFAMHGTGNPSANELFDPDVHGIVSQVLERHIDRDLNGDTTTRFMTRATHAFANGTEGDVSPDWPPQSRCNLPELRREARASGPFAARRWYWRTASARQLGICLDTARRVVERVGENVGAGAIRLFDELGTSLTDTFTISRAFNTLQLARDWETLGICKHAQAGLSALGGAADSYSRMYGWRWLGLIYSGMDQSPRSPRSPPAGCHAQKRLLLWEKATYKLIGSKLPRAAQLGVYRIGNMLLAGVPAEVTTTAGAQILKAMRSVDSLDRAAVVSLTNGFMQYVTTADEYGAQYYEGGSTIYGPGEAAMFARQLAALTGQQSRKDELPTSAGLSIDADTAGGRRADPVTEVATADTVMAAGHAWCEGDTLHARVGLARRGGWIVQGKDDIGRPLVQILRDDAVVAMDDDANLEMRLEPRAGVLPWEVRWRIARPGSYAVRLRNGEKSESVLCPNPSKR
jgi:neutral ceramidase